METNKELLTLQADNLCKQITVLKVNSVPELKKAGDLLFNIKDFIKVWSDKKKELIKPFKLGILGIENEFDPNIDKAKEWKALLEKEMIDFQMLEKKRKENEEKERREQELLRLEKQKDALQDKAVEQNNNTILNEALKVEERQERLMSEPIKVSQTVSGELAKTGLRMNPDYEILIDNDVPREYCSADRGKLRRAVNDGVKEIKGVRIFERPSVTSKM
ncbi:MAG: hypothetical protein WC390_09125 [Sulfurimonas sp.]|jgi:hypothetical protein